MDYGLISGLAEGLKSGVQGYKDAKQLALENQLKQQQAQQNQGLYQAKLGESGYEQNPDQPGLVQPTTLTKQTRELQGGKTSSELAEQKAETPESANLRQSAKNALNASKPGLGDSYIKDNMSGYQLRNDPFLKASLPGEFGLAKAGLMATAASNRLDAGFEKQQNTLDARAHRQILSAIDNNPTIKSKMAAVQAIDQAKALLDDPNIKLTPQLLDKSQQVFNSAAGQAHSIGDERAADYYHSLSIKLGQVVNQVGGISEIPRDHPVVKQMMGEMDMERQNAQEQFKNALSSATSGYDYLYDPSDPKYNPDYAKALNSKISATSRQIGLIGSSESKSPAAGLLKDTKSVSTVGQSPSGLMESGPTMTSYDREAIKWAQDHRNDPKLSEKAMRILNTHGMK